MTDLLRFILKTAALAFLILIGVGAALILLPLFLLLLLFFPFFPRQTIRTSFARFRGMRGAPRRTEQADDVIDADFRVVDDKTDGRPSGD